MKIYVMTGPIQTGKTTWVGKMFGAARERGLRVTGVWSPAIFEDGEKTGINTQLLPTLEEFQLATKRQWDKEDSAERPDGRKKLGWDFSDEAMDRINAHLAICANDLGDLFVVDEFGALEFYQDKGYVEGLRIMDEGLPNNVLLVLRPDLLGPALERWGDYQLLGVESDIDEFLDSVELNQRISSLEL